VDTWKIVVLLPTAILTRSLKSWFAPAVSMNKSGIRLLLLFLKRILKKQKNLTKNSFFLSQIPQNSITLKTDAFSRHFLKFDRF